MVYTAVHPCNTEQKVKFHLTVIDDVKCGSGTIWKSRSRKQLTETQLSHSDVLGGMFGLKWYIWDHTNFLRFHIYGKDK